VKSRIFALLIFFCAAFWAAANPASSKDNAALARCERKLDHIEANGRVVHPNQTPTVLTEQELNAYLASDQIELPAGVDSVKLEAEEPGIVHGTARIDFDKVRVGVRSSNPLLEIFSGIHEVVVNTHARAAEGQGYVHVDSVFLDGIEVPRFVLELFVEKYLETKNPRIGLDSRFALPDRIDRAIVGQHQITLTQK
jgi:hypothetical protein